MFSVVAVDTIDADDAQTWQKEQVSSPTSEETSLVFSLYFWWTEYIYI